jgi:D-amino peptidase
VEIYITLDLEGVSTVTALEQVSHGSPEFAATRVLVTKEINAAIDGALAAGATAFLVNEGHGKHRNVLPDQLNRAARLLTGREKLLHYMQGIERGCAGMFMIGYHAGPDRRSAVLSHTFHAYHLHINGQVFTEIGLAIALAGHFGVPALLVTGDQEACLDAQRMVPNIKTVAVKEGLTGVTAIHLHPQVAQEQITAAAQRAIERLDEIKPFTMPAPLVLDLELYSTLMADMHEYIPLCERTGDRSVRFTADNFLDIFKFFLLSSTLSMTTKGLSVMV